MAEALSVCMGREAAHRIERDGFSPDLFSLLLGASGGAKWLILAHLDRFLFGDYLQRGTQPLAVVGSSIGTWRHTCLAMPDPVAAIDRMQDGYVTQSYAHGKPSPEEVSAVSAGILERVLGRDGAEHVVGHPRIHTHIVTARGRGPSGSVATPLLATGLGVAALSNAVSRRLLQWHFQRVVFHTGEAPGPNLSLHDFETRYAKLDAMTLARSLHASGSIPFVLTGERDIPGAPAGQYWDGGIIDYHFDLTQYCGDGLILYPHFSDHVFPGWFDKFLSSRSTRLAEVDAASRLVLVSPSEHFIADLPFGKIPDRRDFKTLGEEERVRYWEHCIERGRALAEEFAALVDSADPLAGVRVYG